MILDLATIEFESRREIEAVMTALEAWLDQRPNDVSVQELYNKLEVMHMNW